MVSSMASAEQTPAIGPIAIIAPKVMDFARREAMSAPATMPTP